jgi:hypothetical protein
LHGQKVFAGQAAHFFNAARTFPNPHWKSGSVAPQDIEVSLNPAEAELKAPVVKALQLKQAPMPHGVQPEADNRKPLMAQRSKMLGAASARATVVDPDEGHFGIAGWSTTTVGSARSVTNWIVPLLPGIE